MMGVSRKRARTGATVVSLLVAVVVFLAPYAGGQGPLMAQGGGRTYYVATDGSDDNDGRSEDAPFATLQQAADVVEPGDTVLIREGTYPIRVAFTRSGTSEAPITFMSYPGEWAVLDGSGETPYESDDYVLVSEVSWNVFKNFEVKNSPNQGIYVEYSDQNVFDNIVAHDNTISGIQLYDSSNNRLLNIESYGNYDEDNPESGRDGENADGISLSSGHGNYVFNCRTYDNSDDGLDTWEAIGTVIDGCISYGNGYGADGDGNGFKLGPGQGRVASTLIRKSVAYDNGSTGFTTNGGGGIVMQNNTAYDNPDNYAAYIDGPATRRNELVNNIGVRGDYHFEEPLLQTHNSWNLDITDVEFLSTDPAEANFLKLSPDSPAVDAGAEVGLLYYGEAPDLGAYESRSKSVEN